MKSLTFIFLLVSVLNSFTTGLYFYLEGNADKCILEELPEHTTLVGHYKTEEEVSPNVWAENPQTGISVVVEDVTNKHIVTNSKSLTSKGRIAFTAVASGDHSICMSVSTAKWFSGKRVRMHLDIVVGESTTHLDHSEKLSDLALRVRDLNDRVVDIRKEQQYQREREAEFRNTSEATNAKVVWWTLLQFVVLGMTVLWQTRHLRGFFQAKKLV